MNTYEVRRILPRNLLPEVAELTIYEFQGNNRPPIPLTVETMFGKHDYLSDEPDAGFSIALREARLRLSLDGVEISPSRKRYSRSIPQEQFSRLLNKESAKSTAARGGGKLSLKGLLSAILSKLGLEADLEAELRGAIEKGETEKFAKSLVFNIVEPGPLNTWRIGDVNIGDPTRSEGHLGSSYFHLPSDHADANDEDYQCALCELEIAGHKRKCTVVISLEISPQSIEYRRLETSPRKTPSPERAQIDQNKLAVEKAAFCKSLIDKAAQALGANSRNGRIVVSGGQLKIDRKDKW